MELQDDAGRARLRREAHRPIFVEGAAAGTRYSGDHLKPCAGPSRASGCATTARADARPADIDRALTEWIDRPEDDAARGARRRHARGGSRRVRAVSARTRRRSSASRSRATPPGRSASSAIRIRPIATSSRRRNCSTTSASSWAAARRSCCCSTISRSARRATCERATAIARALVEEFGLGGDEVGVGRFQTDQGQPGRVANLSPAQLETLDRRVRELLDEGRIRARTLLQEHRSLVETLPQTCSWIRR